MCTHPVLWRWHRLTSLILQKVSIWNNSVYKNTHESDKFFLSLIMFNSSHQIGNNSGSEPGVHAKSMNVVFNRHC